MHRNRHLPLALFLAACYPLASHAVEAEPAVEVAVAATAEAAEPAPDRDVEIGRASCRERVF